MMKIQASGNNIADAEKYEIIASTATYVVTVEKTP